MAAQAKQGGGAKGMSFNLSRRIAAAKNKEIATVENFIVGYRNREDTSQT